MTLELAGILGLAAFAAFTLSSAVGLGGSLLLVPILVLALGPKEGVALAALLLTLNNVVKIVAYRATLPVRKTALLFLCAVVGAAVGAALLVQLDATVVAAAVMASLCASFALERVALDKVRQRSAPALALASGAASGLSGMSGPLKGVAVKSLCLDRLHTVGAASMLSLAGDVTKTAVFAGAGLLGPQSWQVTATALPLMVIGTLTGRRLTRWLGERRWSALFWATIVGYAARLVLA